MSFQEIDQRIAQTGVVPVIKLDRPRQDAEPRPAPSAAGEGFIVTPGLDVELAAYCLEKGAAVYPGCTAAADYHAALKLGLKVLKFFPAEQSGGLAKIRALSAPFPMFQVMPTGGISLDNLRTYLRESLSASDNGWSGMLCDDGSGRIQR